MPAAGATEHRLITPEFALRAAWVLLAVLFATAIVAHEWTGYPILLGIIAAAAVVVCLLDARASVVLFVGCHALDAYSFVTHWPFSISVARIVVVAVVAGAVLRWLRSKPRPRLDIRRHITVWDLGIVIFLAGAVLSVPFSYSLSLSVVGILHVTFLIGAYFLVSRMSLAEETRADVYNVTIAVGSVSALVALGQAFVARFPVEVLRPAVGNEEAAVRASAFFDNPNTLALLLVLVVLFSAERVWVARRLGVRALYAASTLLSLGAIGVTLSRAALVGIVVGGIVLATLLVSRMRDRAIVVVTLGVVLAAVLSLPGVSQRAESILDFRSDASAMDRVYLAEVSLEMFRDHPLTGVGIQAFRAAYPDYADARVTIDPVTDGHQMPASVPAEIGVLGLVAELLLAGALLYLLAQSFRAGHAPLSPAGLAAMAAISVMALFNTFIFFESLWIAAALVGADYVVAHRRATGQSAG